MLIGVFVDLSLPMSYQREVLLDHHSENRDSCLPAILRDMDDIVKIGKRQHNLKSRAGALHVTNIPVVSDQRLSRVDP